MSDVSDRLLAWYQENGRILPWRNHPDPYAVWVSEIMLQQTQVTTVVPYFERWMRRFPTIDELAIATEQDVLAQWEGLGYYSRARNLHRAAGLVVERYGGSLPRDFAELRALPGIGEYTAAAICSMAFGEGFVALDGNIRRVFARLFNISEAADSPRGENLLRDLAQENLPAGRARDYNQALMDIGATICLPRKPLCGSCPLADLCAARSLGLQEERPVTRPRPAVPRRVRAAAVVIRDGKVLLSRRPSKGLLGGMWEFPDAPITSDPARELAAAIMAAHGLRVIPGEQLGIVRHAYTHFRVIEHVFACTAEFPIGELVWAPIVSLAEYPMGRLARQIARMLS